MQTSVNYNNLICFTFDVQVNLFKLISLFISIVL